MEPVQSRAARAMLKWSLTDLASAAGVGRASAARFELGQSVDPETVAKLRKAFEAKRVRFIDDGPMAGGVFQLRAG